MKIIVRGRSQSGLTVLIVFAVAIFISFFPTISIGQSALRFIYLNCHMDVCSWMAIKEREVIKENSSGKLFGVTTLECSTTHRNGAYPQSYSCKRNEIEESSFVVFCSTKNPTVGFKNSETNKWTRNQLVVAQQGVFGYLISSFTRYLYACHDIVWRGQNLDFLGARLGYRVPSPDASGGQDEVDSILDLMQ